MNRFTYLIAFAFLALASSLAPAQDKITFRNKKGGAKEELKGVIQSESLQGIKIKPFTSGAVEQLIPGSDIIEVEYNPPQNLTAAEMRIPFGREADIFKQTKPEDRAKKIDDTLDAYRKLIPKLETAESAQAYMTYRMAHLLVKLAETEPARLDEARNTLVAFKDKYTKNWEYPRVMQILARIQESQGKYDDARRTFEEMASRPELPDELRGQANFALVRMLLRAGQFEPAESRLQDLEKIVKEPADTARLQVYKVELQVKKGQPGDAEKQLKTILGGPVDDAKAHAANVLGDFYQAAKRHEDALWQYLWVDVLYNKDPDEHARALFHLSKLFKDVRNDDTLAKKAREKLLDPQFAGSEYQRLAAAPDKGSK
jgi:tetratricopeptide (TPR) repeat protein